jgi:hypothetical protein
MWRVVARGGMWGVMASTEHSSLGSPAASGVGPAQGCAGRTDPAGRCLKVSTGGRRSICMPEVTGSDSQWDSDMCRLGLEGLV